MYTGFAAGDVSGLDSICCDSLHSTLRRRIIQRPKDQLMQWEYVQVKKPKLVSHRGLEIPKSQTGGASVALRQIIVRLVSRQRIVKWTRKSGMQQDDDGGGKDVVEYVVLQTRLLDGVESPWLVWGMAEETSFEELEMWLEQQRKAKRTTVVPRASA